MPLQYNPEHATFQAHSLAAEHATPFSDLRADEDTKLARIWFMTSVDRTWTSLDVARGGKSVHDRFEASEHEGTDKNALLLRKIALSAFTLYQPERLTDDKGNILAIALGRRSFVQLGRAMPGPFDVFDSSIISRRNIGFFVDDNDILAIEAYNPSNLPQLELIAADSETAVYSGTRNRSYKLPRSTPSHGEVVTDHEVSVEPLNGTARPIPPQFISGNVVPSKQSSPAYSS